MDFPKDALVCRWSKHQTRHLDAHSGYPGQWNPGGGGILFPPSPLPPPSLPPPPSPPPPEGAEGRAGGWTLGNWAQLHLILRQSPRAACALMGAGPALGAGLTTPSLRSSLPHERAWAERWRRRQAGSQEGRLHLSAAQQVQSDLKCPQRVSAERQGVSTLNYFSVIGTEEAAGVLRSASKSSELGLSR